MDHVHSWEQLKRSAPCKMLYLIIHFKSPIGMNIAEIFCINEQFYLQFGKDTRDFLN